MIFILLRMREGVASLEIIFEASENQLGLDTFSLIDPVDFKTRTLTYVRRRPKNQNDGVL